MQQAKENQRVSLIVRRYLYPNNNNNQLTSKENKKNKNSLFFFYVSFRSI